MRRDFYHRSGVQVFHGHAHFAARTTSRSKARKAPVIHLHAANFVIATGSRPYRPDDVDFSHPRIFDSRHHPHPRSHPELRHHLRRRRRRLRVRLDLPRPRLQAQPRQPARPPPLLPRRRDHRRPLLSPPRSRRPHPPRRDLRRHRGPRGQASSSTSSQASASAPTSSCGPTAAPATPTDSASSNIGFTANGRGQLEVDATYRTAQAHIYAVGDVVGYPSLASAAYDQGRFAATHLVHRRQRPEARARHPDRHLHQPRDQLDRPHRARAHRRRSPTRSATPCFAASPAPRSPA
jgi:NAD(P) transhydrogenase